MEYSIYRRFPRWKCVSLLFRDLPRYQLHLSKLSNASLLRYNIYAQIEALSFSTSCTICTAMYSDSFSFGSFVFRSARCRWKDWSQCGCTSRYGRLYGQFIARDATNATRNTNTVSVFCCVNVYNCSFANNYCILFAFALQESRLTLRFWNILFFFSFESFFSKVVNFWKSKTKYWKRPNVKMLSNHVPSDTTKIPVYETICSRNSWAINGWYRYFKHAQVNQQWKRMEICSSCLWTFLRHSVFFSDFDNTFCNYLYISVDTKETQ